MSEPEILRRCTACGAAARPSALFCPECGNAAPSKGGAAGTADPLENRQPATEQSRNPEAPKPALAKSTAQPQLEKARTTATVFIDEALLDPSTRFLLVAAFLFVVFLVILLLSRVIT